MKLVREYKKGCYEKIYKGDLLIYEYYSKTDPEREDVHKKITRKIEYDKNSRISKEYISEYIDGIQDHEDHRYEINYEYDGESYTKLVRKKYLGYSDINQEDYGFEMKYREVDQIDSILEVKISNGKRLFEQFVSFANGETRQTKYYYKYQLLVEIDGFHEIDNKIFYNSKYEYSGSTLELLKETHLNKVSIR